MVMYNQVTGGASRIVMVKETSFKEVGPSPVGVVVPMYRESHKVGLNKKPSDVITGKRGPGKPTPGVPNRTGGFECEGNPYFLGYLFSVVCGAPTTSEVAAINCDAAAVTDKGGGLVGIPCTGHGFVQDAQISILGSANYDGTYKVESGSTADELIINAGAYTGETMTSVTVHRGRVGRPEGPAVDLSGGKVGIPCLLHGFEAGDPITIDGSVGYDGNYTVDADTSASQIVITATFAAEAFDGTEAVLPRFFRHVYVLPKRQPTMTIDRYLDFDPGAADASYHRFMGEPVSALNLSLNDDGELKITVETVPSADRESSTPLVANPIEVPALGFRAYINALYLDGERRGEIESGQLAMGFNVEGKTGVGTRGEISRLSFKDPNISASITAFLVDDSLQKLAKANATVPIGCMFFAETGEELIITLPETVLDTEGPAIEGKDGQMQSFTAMAFIQNATAMVAYTLINRVATYL